jgi:hypothetical protein
MTFETRQDIIAALIAEFGIHPDSFDYNQSATRFWTYNRLLDYYLKHKKSWEESKESY